MKRALLVLAVALALAGCVSTSASDVDRHVSTHEPKTGGPDL
jgi:PBP1b-binding outer membrane lipoprotein LpoB